MKVRETTSVQEHVVLTNIKALDLCVCECMYTHAITHTDAQTALSLACIDFKIIFSFITYSRQNIMAIGFEAFMFSQSRRKFTNKCFSTEREHINASHHLACHSVRVSAMAKKLSLQEVIDHITDQENSEEETTEDESYSEDALQDILEEENITEQAENLATTEEEQSSDFEGPAEVDVTFWSKDGNLSWSSSPTEKKGRLSTENVIKMTPGLTKYATSRIEDIKSCFNLFLAEPIENIVISMTNLEGRRVYKENWNEVDRTDIEAYIGLLILCGVYKSRNENVASLWDADTGRAIFRATLSQQTFHVLSRVIRFDNRDTRAQRHQYDKLAPIRELWDKWVERLPLIYNPGPEVTVDERLFAFRGRCNFKQYMPKKPAKYGIKMWTVCDAKNSYAWNMQVYTGKLSSGVPEKNQGKRVVLEVTEGLQGHTVICDNFFTSYNLGTELLKKKSPWWGLSERTSPSFLLR